jgi:hypothetical protein
VVVPKGPGLGSGRRLLVATSHLESPGLNSLADEREAQLRYALHALEAMVRSGVLSGWLSVCLSVPSALMTTKLVPAAS